MTSRVRPASSPEDQLKSQRVYWDLRRRIRELALAPGSQLRKDEIAVEYGVSRGPVNEAIARLADEGLIEVFPQSGSFVAPIRYEVIREVLLIRTGLEVEVVRRAAQLENMEWLAQIDENIAAQQQAVHGNNMEKLDNLDEAFHDIIVRAVNAPEAKRLLDRMRAILDRPRFHSLPEEGRPLETVAEHRQIADALHTRDAELSGAAMRMHMAKVSRALEREIAAAEAVAKVKLDEQATRAGRRKQRVTRK